MAFNPFHGFRKHQKAWFAALTIICMLTFVLCTGVGGDFASAFMRLFGRQSGEPVAEMYGKKVYASQMLNLRVQRQMADEFMTAAVSTGEQKVMASLFSQLDEIKRQQLQQILQRNLFNFNKLGFHFSLSSFQDQLKREGKDSIAELVPVFEKLFQENMALGRNKSPGYKYFGGSDSDEALLEFMLWQHEADQLKIELTDDGVRAEVDKATGNQLSSQNWRAIEEGLRTKHQSGTPENIMNGLREEYRVRLAQTARLGYRPGGSSGPAAAVTPEQFWQFYQENRSEFEVQALSVPVAAFLDQVKEKPTEKELQKLFNEYKNQERDPASPKPGFKRPRQVKLAWVTGDPESPEFRQTKDYRLGVEALPDWYRLLSALRPPAPQPWFDRVLPRGVNYSVYAEYWGFNGPKTDYKLTPWTEPLSVAPFRSDKKAWNPAVLAGQLLGSGAGPGQPLLAASAPAAYDAAAFVRSKTAEKEVRKRAGVEATMFLAGTAPASPVSVAGLWHYASKQQQALPLEEVKDHLVQKVKEEAARKQVAAAVKALQKELDEFKPADKPDNIRRRKVTEIVAQAAKEHGLKTGQTTEFHDKHDIGDDPKLEAMKQAFLGPDSASNRSRAREFNQLFFDATEPYIPKQLGMSSPDQPFQMPPAEKPFLYWKTEVRDAKVPDSLAEVRDQVVYWWKFEKARAIARKKARELADAVAKADGPEGRLRRLRDAEKELRDEKVLKPDQKLITLSAVAPLVPSKTPRPDLQTELEPFQIPDNTFDYPRSEWTKKILDLGKSGPKALVLENQPDSVFYVTTRVSTPDARRSDFLAAYRFPGDLWARCQRKYGRDYGAEVVAELKRDAKFQDLRSDQSKAKDERTTGEETGE
jgi:hypothetical protein